MKSLHVLPGSGDNFYCENCVRDNATVRALVQAKEDVVAIPMYLPQIVDKVDLISKSKIWKQSAIFVIEDDSQDGADHVDAHRMPALDERCRKPLRVRSAFDEVRQHDDVPRQLVEGIG